MAQDTTKKQSLFSKIFGSKKKATTKTVDPKILEFEIRKAQLEFEIRKAQCKALNLPVGDTIDQESIRKANSLGNKVQEHVGHTKSQGHSNLPINPSLKEKNSSPERS